MKDCLNCVNFGHNNRCAIMLERPAELTCWATAKMQLEREHAVLTYATKIRQHSPQTSEEHIDASVIIYGVRERIKKLEGLRDAVTRITEAPDGRKSK